MKAAVLGASGYVGGELLRLLLTHPRVEVAQATSDRLAGKPIGLAHPNLRFATDLTFTRHEEITSCDVLFMAMKHGQAMNEPDLWDGLAPLVIDLSADFRLKDPADYRRYYGREHPHPDLLSRFVTGLPELARAELQTASRVAVPGCMAIASILALHPFATCGLVENDIIVDARTGSSGSGTSPTPGTHHAERSGAMRLYQPCEHRHEAEIRQTCKRQVHMTATAVEPVRGVQILARARLTDPSADRAVWHLLRESYGTEPFVRIVKQRSGLYRLPEPKLLTGTNYCDVGFQLSGDDSQIVLIAAVDNLVKGSAGNAVQCLNVAAGWAEQTGLEFTGLHPI